MRTLKSLVLVSVIAAGALADQIKIGGSSTVFPFSSRFDLAKFPTQI